MEAHSSFGEWLRARRKALDLTQFELAERAGCAEDTIGRIEAGTRRPSRQVAALLAEALGVPAQSQADFVRFAREGGSGASLGRIDTASYSSDAPPLVEAPAPLASQAQPTRGHPPAWVPYLSSLPQPPTPLIGREDELAITTALVRSGQARLLTLTGPPGVGKTRLALALASSLIPSFPDGISYVGLAPLRDPDLLGLTVGHALGLSDNAGGGGSQAGRLVEFLRHKRLLLVLDNFEHLLEATQRVGEWLSASSYLQIVVTSRSALHLRGERLFPVSTLPVPPAPTMPAPRQIESLDPRGQLSEVSAYPSVALFVELAQAVDSQFDLTGANWWVVVALCRRMEGLPLAIELTAARSARLAPEIVLTRRERRLDSATGGPRDLPHHQELATQAPQVPGSSLRAAIEWSYELLGEPERLLFDRMSVFAGGATLDALEAVCNAQDDLGGAQGEEGLDDALEGLLEQSLAYRVTVEGEDDIQEGRRFNMLEMLREYAAERLAEREKAWAVGSTGQGLPRTASVRRYHAEYYLAMAEAAELQKWTSRQERWIQRLEREHDNLRAAIQWAIDSGDMNIAAGLCSALWTFWKVRGYLSEGRTWLDKVLAHEEQISPLNVANAMNGAGVLARSQGDYATAESLHERSLAIFRELDNKQGMADCLNNLGAVMIYQARYDRADELYGESLELWRAVGDIVGISRPLHNMGMLAELRHDHLRAASLFRESLEMSRVNGDKDGTCAGLYNLGVVLISVAGMDAKGAGSLDEAERCFTESLALAREIGNKSRLALCLAKLGELSLERGGESNLIEATALKAEALFDQCLALHRELGDRAAIAYTLNDMGHAALLSGDLSNARSLFEESLQVSRTLESRGHTARNLHGLAITLGASALASSSREAELASSMASARRAAQLYAASEAIYTPSHIPVLARYYQVTMDALHRMLPWDEVETLQALGQAMSLDEAIAFALDS